MTYAYTEPYVHLQTLNVLSTKHNNLGYSEKKSKKRKEGREREREKELRKKPSKSTFQSIIFQKHHKELKQYKIQIYALCLEDDSDQ